MKENMIGAGNEELHELVIEATRANLHELFHFLTENMAAYGCDSRLIRQCRLCAEEIFLNEAKYAYLSKGGQVRIGIKLDEAQRSRWVVLRFVDEGVPFDPLMQEKPDTESGIEDRQPGGLGIYLVVSTMDAVNYEYKNGENILTMKKEIVSGEGSR